MTAWALVWAIALPANTDILVRFPTNAAGEQVSALAGEIGRETGMKTWGVTGVVDTPDAAKDPPEKALSRLEKAQKAYKQLDLEKAESQLDKIEADCLAEAPVARCRSLLFEADMLRAVVASAMGDQARADQYFRSAHLVDPAKVVDPRIYPPRTIRAYNSACAAGERIEPAQVRLRSIPEGAAFTADGNPVDPSGPISLGPGRHVVEASLTGYAQAREIIEIDAQGSGPPELTLTLARLPDLTAWEQLRQEISVAPYDMTRPGLDILFERFDIEYIVILEPKRKGQPGVTALLATPGKMDLRPLPEIPLLAQPLPKAFVRALRDALGLAPQETKPEPPEPAVIVPPVSPDVLEEDEETEEALVRLDPDEEVQADDSDLDKIITSPWFWVSVGIAAAMVTGVVVGAQVD